MAAMRTYRTGESIGGKTRVEIPIGGMVLFTVPEPPTMDEMIRRIQAAPRAVIYARTKNQYKEKAMLHVLAMGHRRPATPWKRWALIKLHYRLHATRDPLELPAGAKWIADMFVQDGWFANDSARELTVECIATQEVDRANRGVDFCVRRDG